MILNIAKDYTKTPGGRYSSEGEFSGENFRENLLKPRYLESKRLGERLTVVLDGGFGYAPSFIEEAFGGLARELRNENIKHNIEIVSNEDVSWIKKIDEYILSARK